MLCILTLALTSYDIHPIGCLSPIGVSYNEEVISNFKRFRKCDSIPEGEHNIDHHTFYNFAFHEIAPVSFATSIWMGFSN